MAMTPRMREALHRIESRRVALEREIVAEMEARFFTEPAPWPVAEVLHVAGIPRSDAPVPTGCGSSFVLSWFA